MCSKPAQHEIEVRKEHGGLASRQAGIDRMASLARQALTQPKKAQPKKESKRERGAPCQLRVVGHHHWPGSHPEAPDGPILAGPLGCSTLLALQQSSRKGSRMEFAFGLFSLTPPH